MPCEMSYWHALGIAFDQLVNAAFRGWPDETLCSRAWRWDKDGVRRWPRVLLDAMMFWDPHHCENSYHSERLGRQLPPEMRSTSDNICIIHNTDGKGAQPYCLHDDTRKTVSGELGVTSVADATPCEHEHDTEPAPTGDVHNG